MNKQAAIDNLYAVFSKYTPADMYYCDCGCIDPADVKQLASKKLRELEEDDLSSYHGSALCTWGGVSHYKHFLPRILEVYDHNERCGLIGLYEITHKLAYANWQTWDESELKTIKNFIFCDWADYVNASESQVSLDGLGGFAFFFDLKDLVKEWSTAKESVGLRNFVDFYYYEGTEIINRGMKGKDMSYYTIFNDFIHQDSLLKSLEDTFFSVESEDVVYGEKISIVIQMIEQQRKMINTDGF